MKEMLDKNGKLQGYEFLGNEQFMVHSHINSPDHWYLTIRSLEIFGKILCHKSSSKEEIKRAIMGVLRPIEKNIKELIKIVE